MKIENVENPLLHEGGPTLLNLPSYSLYGPYYPCFLFADVQIKHNYQNFKKYLKTYNKIDG